MKIAVMSDLHDNTVAWGILAQRLAKDGVVFLVNCGDTCAPAMLEEMSKTYRGHIDTIFGNVADEELETQVAAQLTNVTHHGHRGIITLEGKKIFFCHKPAMADEMALTGDIDLVCHGHTHLKRWEKKGDTYILNPGTAGGMFQYPSYAMVDLETMRCSFHEITL